MNSTRRVQVVLGLLLVVVGRPLPARAQTPANENLIAVGDRVLLQVDGEAAVSDTFAVSAGPILELPGLGTIPLAGVPRDSVEPYLATHLARYFRQPVVHAKVLLRLAMLGEVVRPGFYALPADAALEDLIMIAGGVTRDARLERAQLRRDETVLLQKEEIRTAIATGRSLTDLHLRSGDALEIPRRPDQEGRVRTLSAIVALPIAIYGLLKLF